MTDDLQQARISTEVLNEYRKIAAWLEAQAATRGPVGDTMHGLAAEALTKLIEMGYSRHMIPLYGMLDVWMATRGTSHPEFDQFYSEHGYAETWSRLLADVRALAAADAHLPSQLKLSEVLLAHRRNKAINFGADYACICGEVLRSNSHYAQAEHQARKIAALFGEVAGDVGVQ